MKLVAQDSSPARVHRCWEWGSLVVGHELGRHKVLGLICSSSSTTTHTYAYMYARMYTHTYTLQKNTQQILQDCV